MLVQSWERKYPRKSVMPLISIAAALALMMGYFERDPFKEPLPEQGVTRTNITATKYLQTLPANDCQVNGPYKNCKWVFKDENGTTWWVFQHQPLQ